MKTTRLRLDDIRRRRVACVDGRRVPDVSKYSFKILSLLPKCNPHFEARHDQRGDPETREADTKRSRRRGIIAARHQGLARSQVVSLVAPAGREPVAFRVLAGSVVTGKVEVASFAREAPMRRNAIVLAAYQVLSYSSRALRVRE